MARCVRHPSFGIPLFSDRLTGAVSMAVSQVTRAVPARARGWRWVFVLLSPMVALAGMSWWLTAPLADPPAGAPPERSGEATSIAAEAPRDRLPAWPEGRLDGRAAKELLLRTLLEVD